ncbi:MAG: zinc-ribbon domain-containing protein [Planctomycetes bacterium]|nr:zinc-ribbon domain-containing protein [Planctomycetota bacterium]
MPIPVTCPQCEKALRIKDEFAGKIVECPRCQDPISVPNMMFQHKFIEAEEKAKSKETGERIQSIKIFGEIRDPYGWPIIASMLTDREPKVCSAAFAALLENEPVTTKFVQNFLQNSQDTAIPMLRDLWLLGGNESAFHKTLSVLEVGGIKEQWVAYLICDLGKSKQIRAIDTLNQLKIKYPHFESFIKSSISRLESPESGLSALTNLKNRVPANAKASCFMVFLGLVSAAAIPFIWLFS